VDELGLGPEGVQGGDAAHPGRDFASRQALASGLSVQIKDAADEVRIREAFAGCNQPLKVLPVDLQGWKPMVLDQPRNHLRRYQTFGREASSHLKIAGDPIRL